MQQLSGLDEALAKRLAGFEDRLRGSRWLEPIGFEQEQCGRRSLHNCVVELARHSASLCRGTGFSLGLRELSSRVDELGDEMLLFGERPSSAA